MKCFDAVESYLERHAIKSLWLLHEIPLMKWNLEPTPPFRMPMMLMTQAEVRELNDYMKSKEYKGEFG